MNLGTSGAQAADHMQQSAVQASAQSANQPDGVQPNPSDAPDSSSGSAASILGGPSPAPAQSPQQQPAPQMTPQQAQFTHDTAFGRAAKFLLGTPQSYSVDPATGQTVATNDPQPPGQLFRSILAGALLGGAVGSQSKTGSGLASAAQGGAAVLNAQKQEDLTKRANAQRDFENGQQVDKINQEKIFQQAQIAAMHVSNVNAQRGLDLSSQEHIDNLNKYNTGLQSAIDDAPGSQHPPVLADGSDINGKMGNGGALMAAYTKDPRVMDPPQGFHRTVTSKVDYSGLNFDGEKGWVDKDGQPVDIATRTTNTISDIPESIFKKQVSITGAQANSYFGAAVYKPGEKLNTSVGDLVALNKQAMDRSVEQEKVQIEDRRAKSHAGVGGKGAGAPASEGDPEGSFEVNAKKLADGTLLLKDLPKRNIKGSPSVQDYIARADAISRQAYGKPYDATVIAQENKFAEQPKTQAYFGATGRLLGGTKDIPVGLLDQLIDTASKAGLGNHAPLNDIEQHFKRYMGDDAAKNFQTVLLDTRRALNTAVGNPLISGSDSDIKLKQISDSIGENPTLQNIRTAAATLKQTIATERASTTAGNRFLQKRYGDQQPATGNPSSAFSVTDPNGKVHNFPSKATADFFRKNAGIQ